MSTTRTSFWVISSLAIAGLVVTYWFARQTSHTLGNASALTGYVTLAVLLSLALFNTRKKLSMLPMIKARTWLLFHVIMGFAVLLLYWLHTGVLWPTGLYEQIIAALFYVVCITGIVGFILSRTIPVRLRNIGNEIIYERIPHEIYTLRETAKSEVLAALSSSGNETLAREFKESLAWFFAKPRFKTAHLSGSGRAAAWVERKASSLKPFLSDEEAKRFDEVVALMHYKNQIDAHYANQNVLKYWLFLHLPLTVALLVFTGWHVLLVHLYAL
jgi:hypothetical protein